MSCFKIGSWQSLSALVSEFSSGDEVQSVVSKRQRDFEEKHELQSVGNYIITYYDQNQKPHIAPSNLLLNLVLNPLVLDVVNSYLGLWSKLIYFDMWYTLPLNTATRILSQRWHRDPEDRRKVRTFLYLSEVEEASGAMAYFAGSHSGGPYEHVLQWADPLGIPYPPEGEVERQIPARSGWSSKGRQELCFSAILRAFTSDSVYQPGQANRALEQIPDQPRARVRDRRLCAQPFRRRCSRGGLLPW